MPLSAFDYKDHLNFIELFSSGNENLQPIIQTP